ncbi:CDP-diacylglycerol--glycerol-3-phosphate 3-phosphatidyltransferase [bacterium]|nr:CDP-diacylglycerol--glycerol-3-phosphate 3-phosphatidyltransferase [bacterium]
MNLPNKLTTSRMVMTFAFLAVLLSGVPYSKTVALFLFAVASVTDMLDGFLARKKNMITDFGKLMDPLADKILISAAFISFVQWPETQVRAWMAVVIVAREFAVTGLRLLAASRGILIAAWRGGRNKMVSQVIAAAAVLLFLSLNEFFPSVMAGAMRLPSAITLNLLLYFTVILTAVTGVLFLLEHKELILRGV